MNTMQDIASFASVLARDGSLKDIGKVFTPRAEIRSLSSFAGNAIYYFPVLCSSSVSPESAGMVAKALECSYCSFTRATFSLQPAMEVASNSVNVVDYLKQFHQNLGIDSSYHSIRLHESAMVPYTTLNNGILNEATIDINAVKNSFLNNSATHHTYDAPTPIPVGPQKVKPEFEKAEKPDVVDKSAKYRDSDYERTNSLEPSLINVNVKFIVGEHAKIVDVTMPVGVKTQLHVLNAEELTTRVTDSIVSRGIVHELIRWKTGEMLSLKDIIFGVSKIKKDVSNNSDVSQWFNALDSRKRLADISLPAINKMSFLPNTSVVLSISDVKALQAQYGIDLLNASDARKLIKNNFLLAFVVADDMTDMLYVLYDGHSNFEQYPYNTVERDNNSHNREMQVLIRALGNR